MGAAAEFGTEIGGRLANEHTGSEGRDHSDSEGIYRPGRGRTVPDLSGTSAAGAADRTAWNRENGHHPPGSGGM